MNTFRLLSSAAVAAVILGAPASAAVITSPDQVVVLPGPTAATFEPISFAAPLIGTFDQFDASLGTLISVNVTLFGEVTGTLTGMSDSEGTTSSQYNAVLTLELTSGPDLAVVLPTIVNSEDFGPGGGSFSTTVVSSDDVVETLTDASTLSAFTGTGTIDLLLQGTGTQLGGGPGSVTTGAENVGGRALATISYTYDTATVVPLPASGVLLLAGLGGIAALRKRRAV